MSLSGQWFKYSIATAGLLIMLFVVTVGWYWSDESTLFDVQTRTHANSVANPVTGYTTTHTLIKAAQTLLDKRGGYISNDILPPGVWLDNISNWEFGVLIQIRDLARSLRNDMSRSQTQSQEDPALSQAEPKFNFDNNSWILPATESKYREGIELLEDYLQRLSDADHQSSQFYARADNLNEWLKLVETRLGSLSQRLSASIGQERLNTDLAGESDASQSTETPSTLLVKTPWHKVDDVFYQARGQTWALIHFLKAAEIDFKTVLEKKNARISLKQIIRELEATQQNIWSPVILNGRGFGIVTNHSLIMASYISRANAAIIDLRKLLVQG